MQKKKKDGRQTNPIRQTNPGKGGPGGPVCSANRSVVQVDDEDAVILAIIILGLNI